MKAKRVIFVMILICLVVFVGFKVVSTMNHLLDPGDVAFEEGYRYRRILYNGDQFTLRPSTDEQKFKMDIYSEKQFTLSIDGVIYSGAEYVDKYIASVEIQGSAGKDIIGSYLGGDKGTFSITSYSNSVYHYYYGEEAFETCFRAFMIPVVVLLALLLLLLSALFT